MNSDEAPTVSVIIPTYNRASCVIRAVDSALDQSHAASEVIVVDDGSTDDTEQRLQPYRDRIRYVYQENQGVSAARNTGIQHAIGEWIAFLDSDDVWYPNKLKVQIDAVRNSPGGVAHTANIHLPRPGGRKVASFEAGGVPLPSAAGIIERPYLCQLVHGTLAMSPGVLCLKSAAVAAGLFDPQFSIYEDYDFFCRLALRGKWAYTQQPLAEACRMEGDAGYLSSVLGQPIGPLATRVSILEKLLAEPNLTAEERAETRRRLQAACISLGTNHLKESENTPAMDLFRKALCQGFSIRAILGCGLALCPSACSSRVSLWWGRRSRRVQNGRSRARGQRE